MYVLTYTYVWVRLVCTYVCAYVCTYVRILFCSEPEEEEREGGPGSPTGLEERLEVLQQQLLALDQLPG